MALLSERREATGDEPEREAMGRQQVTSPLACRAGRVYPLKSRVAPKHHSVLDLNECDDAVLGCRL